MDMFVITLLRFDEMDEIHNYKFGLRHKKSGKIVTYYIVPNNGDDCYVLDISSEKLWFVDTKENAEWVRQYSTEWYNACHDTPNHSFKPEELEVVEINIIIKAEKVDVTIPTPLEFFEKKYKTNPSHLEYLKKLIKEEDSTLSQYYNLYELKEYLRQN